MRRQVLKMTTVLATAVTVVVVAAVATGGLLLGRHHYNHLLEQARVGAHQEADLIRMALEHQMLENERGLIREMVEGFGKRPGIARVMLLDRAGRPRVTSSPLPEGFSLTPDSPTCTACHDRPPEQREESVVLETDDGSVLRTVVPILNREACHRCHDPKQRINGVLIVDSATAAMKAELGADVWWFSLGSGAVALVLIGGIAGILRTVVTRRLQRFEETARGIAAGDLSRRVPDSGEDTIGWLAREFNTVADSASQLLGEVQGQQERLERILNSIDDGVVMVDRELHIVAANTAFLSRFGADRRSMVGTTCGLLTHGHCHIESCPARGSFLTAGRHVGVATRVAEDGTVRYEEVRSSPLRGPDGTAEYAVEVWRDITERKLSEARMAESHRLASLGLLASGFSHELNTPLGSVLTCVEGILRADAGANEDVGEYARLARAELLRCRGITQQFLRLSRGQGAGNDLLSVEAAVSAVVRLVQPTAREHGVSVALDTQPAPDVLASEGELQQVIMNLVLNAIQACQRGGHVKVSTRDGGGGHVVIAVQDDGRGIPASALTRVFEPFVSMRPGGTGLGLFVSKNLVRGFGGDITVESEEGRGTRFEVQLRAAGAEVEVHGEA